MVRSSLVYPADDASLSPGAAERFDVEAVARAPGRLASFRLILREPARQYSLPLADVHGEMQKTVATGTDQWEQDGSHLNFVGYRSLVRAVLNAMNLPDVRVPATARILPAPGIFT